MKTAHLLIGYTLFAHLPFCAARMLAPLNAIALGAGPATIGLMLAMFGLVTMLTSVAVGRWLDRGGTRRALWWSALMLVGTLLVPALWQGMPALFLLCLGCGTAWNIVYLAVVHVLGMGDDPDEKLGNFSTHSALMSVSSFLGPMIAGVVIDHAGFVAAIWLLAAFPLVVVGGLLTGHLPIPAAACQPRARPVAAPAAAAAVAAPVSAAGSASSARGWRTLELLRAPGMGASLYLGMLMQGLWNLYQFLIPAHAAHLGMSATAIGVLLGFFALASMGMRLATASLARRFSRWGIMGWASLLCALALGTLPWVEPFVVHALIAVVLGGALGMATPLSLAIAHAASPPDRVGEAVGLRITLLAAVQTFGPALAGLSGTGGGFGPVFGVLALFALSGWLVAWRFRPDRTRPSAS